MAKRWGINREKLFTYAKEGAYQAVYGAEGAFERLTDPQRTEEGAYQAVYGAEGAFERLTDPQRTEEDVRDFVKKLADLDAISSLLEEEKARKTNAKSGKPRTRKESAE